MKEQGYQTKVQKYLKKKGYIPINIIRTNKNGIPDLLILLGGGRHFWIEMKDLNGQESKIQAYRRKQLIEHGDISIVCRGYDDFLIEYQKIIGLLRNN